MRCVHVCNKLHRQSKARIRTAITTNKNEAIAGYCNAHEAVRKVWTAYLHHREISAQDDWKNLKNDYNILLLSKLFWRLKIYWTIQTSRYRLYYWDVAQANFLHSRLRRIYLSHVTRYSAFDVSAFFRKRSHIWRNETFCKEFGMHCFQRWIGLNICYRIQTTEVFDWSIHEQFQSLIRQPGITVDKTHCFGRWFMFYPLKFCYIHTKILMKVTFFFIKMQ